MNPAASAMAGKTCLVTGGTSGIGLVTARELARHGATVLVVGRDVERGDQAVAAIRRETGNAAVEFLAADLSVQAQVRALAREVLARHPRLHVLINNAGAMYAMRRESVDGIEMTLALNHLGPFLLTSLLLDALRAAAPARIVTLSSEAHRDVPGFDFADPQAARSTGFGRYPRSEWGNLFNSLTLPMAHPGFLQYARSKLANVLFTTELARQLEGTGVTANAANPGMVASSFSAGNGSYGWFLRRLVSLRGVSVDEGAATPLHLAIAPELETISGEYFTRQQPVPSADAGRDPDAAARLWALSEEMSRESSSA